jgi:hypothetical protein
MSTSSEEFRKFVNRLLYEDTSTINSQNSTNHTENQTAASQILINNFATLTESTLRATLNINKFKHHISNFITSNHLKSGTNTANEA